MRQARQGLQPHPLFDGGWYLARHPDAAAAGIAPLLHYVTVGAAEGRDPHPLFDAAAYRRRRGAMLKGDALADYLAAGARTGAPMSLSASSRLTAARRPPHSWRASR